MKLKRPISVPRKNYTVSEVAAQLGTSHSHVLGLIHSGAISAIDVSTNPSSRARYIIPESVVEEFLDVRTVRPKAVVTATRRRKATLGTVTEFFK